MKKGFLKGIAKVPVLLMAVAVCPSAMAQAPSAQSVPTSVLSNTALDQESATAIPATPNTTNSSTIVPAGTSVCDPNCCDQGCYTHGLFGCQCGPGDNGGYTFQWAPDKWCNVGTGVRTSFGSVTEGAPGGGNAFDVNDWRLYFNGKINKVVGFEANTEINESPFNSGNTIIYQGNVQLLDAIVKFEFNDYLNIWAGRMLVPADRQVLSGPFFINDWDFPIGYNYTAIFAGRDNGVTLWGQPGGGRIQYSFGAFNGTGRIPDPGQPGAAGVANGNGTPMFAMRVEANLLDPEPGYYKQGSYYGTKDILALGFALQSQADAIGTGTSRQNVTNWSFDLLFENKMTDYGSLTVDAAYWNYQQVNPGIVPNPNADPYVSRGGQAGMVYVGWLLPQEFNFLGLYGRFRPFVRYQQYNYGDQAAAAAQGLATEETDGGLEYNIKAQSARVMATYGREEVVGFGWENNFKLGAQINF